MFSYDEVGKAATIVFLTFQKKMLAMIVAKRAFQDLGLQVANYLAMIVLANLLNPAAPNVSH